MAESRFSFFAIAFAVIFGVVIAFQKKRHSAFSLRAGGMRASALANARVAIRTSARRKSAGSRRWVEEGAHHITSRSVRSIEG